LCAREYGENATAYRTISPIKRAANAGHREVMAKVRVPVVDIVAEIVVEACMVSVDAWIGAWHSNRLPQQLAIEAKVCAYW
jgi:hypothetical protein